MIERERLLSHLQGEHERHVGARVVDAIAAALERQQPVATPFFDPEEQRISLGIIESVPEISYRACGGYPRAERKRYLLFPQYYLAELAQEPIGVLEITSESAFDTLGHRDVLGAILALGIKREKVGDIIVTSRGAQAILASEVTDFVRDHLLRVGRAPVRVEVIDPERLEVEPERVKEIRTTVASLRLDAVASAGFGTSRTKMVREIKAERVKVNWQAVRDPARPVEVGDVLSIRGRGRVVIAEASGTTKKGRLNVLLRRYS